MPFKAGLRAVPPARLNILDGLPGINYQNDTVTFESEDYWDARMNGWVALMRIARTGHASFRLGASMERHDDRRKIGLEINDALLKRWLDYESGRWKPPNKK